MEVRKIGTNAITATIGEPSPTTATINPSVAARLYAGAVDATPMTMEETSPRAPGLSPFSVCSSVNPGDTSAAATGPPLTAAGSVQRFQHRNVLKVSHSVIARRLNLRNQKVKA